MMDKVLKGQVYSRLTVLSFSHCIKRNNYWKCQCVCGNTPIVRADALRAKQTKSCGCLQKELTIQKSTTHSLSKTIEYKTLKSIMDRCLNKNNRAYKDYGGRGIGVCKRWLKVENFYKDMGDRPSPQHSIDRINNDKGYCKSNCRWVTWSVQARNRRKIKSSSKYIGVRFNKGSKKWSANIGIGPKRLYLGLHDSEVDAAIAYDFASLILHQDGIGLNFKTTKPL